MRELLEGRRLGFALRPLFGAVALGLAVALTLLDLMAWFGWGSRDTNGFVIASYWLAVATAVVSVFALVTALVELGDIADDERTLARMDAAAVGLALLLYVASGAFRAFDLGAAAAQPLPFLLAIAGLIVLGLAAVVGSTIYAAREWEEIEEITHDRHRRRRMVAR